MIVEAQGSSVNKIETSGALSAIVSTTGTAYTKRGKIAAVIRFVKRGYRFVKRIVVFWKEIAVETIMMTKTGGPTAIDPPAKNQRAG